MTVATGEAVREQVLSRDVASVSVARVAVNRHLVRKLVTYGSALLLVVWTVIPIYYIINISLMYKEEMVSVPAHLIPQTPTISTYLRIFDLPAYGPTGARLDPVGQSFLVRQGWLNSFKVAIPVTIVTMLVSLPIAYAMGRLKFRGKTGLLLGLLSTRSYPPIATIIPFSALFLLLGLQSSIWGLILIYLTLTIPLIAWIMSGFFASMPRNVEDAARIDGLTRFGAFRKVLVPMAMPGVAACAVIAFLTCWNEFTFSLILATGSAAQTYPPTLAGMLWMYAQINEVAAVCVMGLIPPAVLAFMFQRRIRSLNIVNPL
jgi:multiple sugar transport system permease protein